MTENKVTTIARAVRDFSIAAVFVLVALSMVFERITWSGRYEVRGSGNNVVKVDTWTGRTWFLYDDPSSFPLRWQPIKTRQ